jgi:hypothetical protein
MPNSRRQREIDDNPAPWIFPADRSTVEAPGSPRIDRDASGTQTLDPDPIVDPGRTQAVLRRGPRLDPGAPLAWSIHAAVEYVPAAWTKNRTMVSRRGPGPSKRLHRRSAAARDVLVLALQRQIARHRVEVHRGPLHVAGHVRMPSHRSDAHNATALALDAVQLATDLDDRWYHLESWTWDVHPADPVLLIQIGQTIAEPHTLCSGCHLVLCSRTAFRASKTSGEALQPCLVCREGRR